MVSGSFLKSKTVLYLMVGYLVRGSYQIAFDRLQDENKKNITRTTLGWNTWWSNRNTTSTVHRPTGRKHDFKWATKGGWMMIHLERKLLWHFYQGEPITREKMAHKFGTNTRLCEYFNFANRMISRASQCKLQILGCRVPTKTTQSYGVRPRGWRSSSSVGPIG